MDGPPAFLHEWGVVAFDDHINLHAPGVVAAVWKEIASGRLVPFCMTERKMYAQLSPPRKEHLASLKEWAHAHPLLEFSTRSLFGHEITITGTYLGEDDIVRFDTYGRI